jgi:iron-sulfur cluster assembly protein
MRNMLTRARGAVQRNLFSLERIFSRSKQQNARRKLVSYKEMDLTVTLRAGEALLDALLRSGAAIGHDCEGTLACATCRVVVREGMQNLEAPGEDETDMLERASAAMPGARLACQAIGKGPVRVTIPRPEAPPLEAALSLTVTPQAARHLVSYLQREPGSPAIRLAVEPSGCSGFRYRVLPAGTPLDGDSVFDAGGLKIVVDSISLPFVQGTTIDLAQEGLARRLRFDNPNARQRCGCGESFGT